MKPKVILLAVGLLGFVAAKANGDDPGVGTCQKGKKDDLNGTVIHSDSKKPLKDVSVTAFLVSKKEKIVLTNEEGGFAFDELKPGTYKFVFEKAGFKKVTKEKIVVKTDEAFQLNIEMIESGSYDLMPSPFHFSDF
ncbi:MAG: carboxypeptidase regulatory-like domain-containing protein [Chitinophagales bacterium]|nr:carboxypeptidase regulatory-like domain-containing protein [Chitinophagales bacterium]